MKVCVIFNPAARGEKAARFREHLATLSAQCTLKLTTAAGAGRALAAEAVREGFDVVVAAGGDGTVNEVLNGIGDVPESFARVRLGVLPLGTVNVFARELGLPTDFHSAWAVIRQERELLIDLAEAEFTQDGRPQRRLFVQLAGAGWDSRAIELVDWELKKKIGPLAYVFAGLKAWCGPLPEIVATNGRDTFAGPLVLIGNGQFYGGNWRLFPLADLRDGLLEVTVFPNLSCLGVLRGTWAVLTNRLYRSGGAYHFKAETLDLFSAAPVALQVEGENIGHLPARFSVRKQALRVLVP